MSFTHAVLFTREGFIAEKEKLLWINCLLMVVEY